MKTILGLDLGTNSIGWALIKQDETEKIGEVLGAGSRIIPMSQDILDKFGIGQSVSQTAERTKFRGSRRLRERHLLRRERLHRVLNILNFLPEHYSKQIDFEKNFGQFLQETEPKIAYTFNTDIGRFEFIFKKSFEEMILEFKHYQPQLFENGKKIPFDWSIYYLRKKALYEKIEKEELAWLLLHFNQKRGYYQLRGEDEEKNENKIEEYCSLKVISIEAIDNKKNKDEIWYNVHLENGLIYKRSSKIPLDWVGKTKDFIITTEFNDDGSIKKDKEGKEKRSFRAPKEEDWSLVKKKTEAEIEKRKKTVGEYTVGEYIYETLLQNPNQKINGKLVRVVERKFYKTELEAILKKQQEFHAELKDNYLYTACLEELYEFNDAHKKSINQKDFVHLFLNDIIFYQRPLKSKKSLISNCSFESRKFIKEGKIEIESIKCIAKSHPLFQEFRLWQFIKNLKIYEKEKRIKINVANQLGLFSKINENTNIINSQLFTDVNVTHEFLRTEDDYVKLFDWLNERKEIDQKAFLKYPAFNIKKNIDNYRWNYVEDKIYPCNETYSQIKNKLNNVENLTENFLDFEKLTALWHILYSVDDKNELKKALTTFAGKNNLGTDFVEQFIKIKPFQKEYGAYSAKAIKKLLPLMRMGKYWNEKNIDGGTRDRIEKILNGEFDEKISQRVREKVTEKIKNLQNLNDFKGLDLWLTSYIVYNRHSEDGEQKKWKNPNDINLIKQHSINNPIVEQVINETLQVVKDIWKQFGNSQENFFDEIHVELGREMKLPAKEREVMTKRITENENTNLRIKALLIELKNDINIENVRPYSPSQQEILKIFEEGALNSEEEIPEDILKITKLAQPTSSELVKYKLWLEQKYCSPYTGQIIPLSKLFTREYDIEHIIPQSRYFDDSLSNKVICETVVNGQDYKANQTGLEFIKNRGGQIVTELSAPNKTVRIFTQIEYETFIKDHYAKLRTKMKKLLMEEIPESFIERQMNDTRYISKTIKNLLSNILRQEDEQETVSKNLISSTGGVTSILKQDWGLNDIWNDIITPRFERMNLLTKSSNYGEWTNKDGHSVFQTQVPLEFAKGFNKKRLDHRHHALDAIIIACASRSHINFLNNQNALEKSKKKNKDEVSRLDLRNKLCFKKYNDNVKDHYKWVFHKPWQTFTQDVKEQLLGCVVSFKQNLRVINNTTNNIQKWNLTENNIWKKKLVSQKNEMNWAIRKPLHKDTVSGLVQLKFKKMVSLSVALGDWEMIVDKEFKKQIKYFIDKKYTKEKIIKLYSEHKYEWNGKNIKNVEVYYWDKENVATRKSIDISFDSKTIESITDTGIQKILLNHLKIYNTIDKGKIIENPELAFSPDGLDELNKNILLLNDDKPHKPIFKARVYEPMGNKFAVGHTGNKKDKYVEAAKGTNLFFAIYQDANGKRNYDTIPLNIVIDRQKQGLSAVHEINKHGDKLLFWLSPNDLVYVPTKQEQTNIAAINFNKLNLEQVNRIYKMVSSSGFQCFFIRHDISKPIVNKLEFSSKNKIEKSIEGIMIKDICIKLKINRLGNIKQEI